jgi:cyclic pyranopterin phosphate synthase
MARMVDIGDKDVVKRTATAEGRIVLKPSTLRAIKERKINKGDVLSLSKLAGIQAAKATAVILPLCHQIPLTSVEVDMDLEDGGLTCRCTVSAFYRTGVEMESLVGATVALLNVWDMVKYLEKDKNGQYPATRISDVKVVRKVKGGGGRGRR